MTESKKISPGLKQYLDIKAEYSEYLLFYRLGDFYELFFDDARIVAKVLGLALTKRGKMDDNDVPMCGVPFHSYETYLARLIRLGYKVAICEQMEDPKEAKKRGSNAIVKREVVRIVTSGTLTEDELLIDKRNNYLLCVCKIRNSLGVAWADLSTGELFTQEIYVSEENCATEFNNILVRLDAQEILISDAMLDNSDFFRLFQTMRDKLSVVPQARFNYENALRKITEFYEVKTTDSFGKFTKTETIATGILLDYIEITQKIQKPRVARPIKILSDDFMEIDASTRHHLDLFRGEKGTTLISVMDYTITSSGARMLASRIAMPLLDVVKINKRLDIVEFFVKNRQLCKEIRDILRDCSDIERQIGRLAAGHGGPKDMLSICLTLKTLPALKMKLETFEAGDTMKIMPESVKELLKNLADNYAVADNLEQAIQDNMMALPRYARDGNFIKNGYNAELDRMRSIRDRSDEFLQEFQKRYVAETGIDSLKVKSNSIVGFFVEVPNKYAPQLLNNPKFVHRQSVMNATRFTTIELSKLENEKRTALEKALAIEIELYKELLRQIMVAADDLIASMNKAAEIDVGAAMAELAVNNDYCRPQLSEQADFSVIEGRHPVVEQSLKRMREGEFVGNDCQLDLDNDRLWLITGPNMAGKSTFLRQNALIAIMAQVGSYVPAKSAKIGIIDKLFSRIGASDDLSRGRSTFMVEMVETASILNRATSRSFVILDEIGRGTSTYDGLSIAWAVAEYLHDVNKCRSLFATHYHELVDLKEKLDAMSLHCMKIKEINNNVVFLHEVINGTADRSYGVHVAKLAGLPDAVIKRSEQVLKHLEQENQQKEILALREDLPLFSFMKKEAKDVSPVEEALEKIDPDGLSAREALQKLYDLKELIRKK